MDELLYVRPGSGNLKRVINADLRQHYQKLEDAHIGQITYMNFEAVPETSEGNASCIYLKVENYFEECSLFKRHYCVLPISSQSQVGLDSALCLLSIVEVDEVGRVASGVSTPL